jgi:uncharacterized protein YbjT (DUF2867 family)
MTPPPVLLTGGTGTLGRRVLPLLRDAGREVRVLSRHGHAPGDGVHYVTGDLTTGEGADAAVEGVETVVHCAGTARGDGDKARHLVRAAEAAGTVRHLVFVSVVGADRVPVTSAVDRAVFGYYASKRDAERVVENSGIPWTTLRATQFHELLLTMVRPMARLPVVPGLGGVRFQPVDAGEVAERLAELSLGEPAGLVPEMGGPRVATMSDLIREYLRIEGRRRPVVTLPLAGGAARALREGAHLTPDHAVGRRTWEEFLRGWEAAALR